MIGGDVLRLQRRKILPGIQDFSADHDELRYPTSIRSQPYLVWFWMSPDCYKIVYYGPWVSIVFLSLAVMVLALWNGGGWVFVYAFLALGGWSVWQLVKLFRNRLVIKGRNLYDLYLRDEQ